MKLAVLAGSTALAMALAFPVHAHEKIYTVILDGPSEAPPNASLGHGTATITFDLDLVTMRVQATFAGLTGNVTASHIHCCTTFPGISTAGVATVTPTFTGFPSGVKSGTYDHLFDMTLAGSYNPAFITAHGSVSGALNDLLAGLDAGKGYLNIHTNAVPSGEIRGFLAPVPEPETYAMFLSGLGILGAAARRRKVAAV
ncbi:MAG TPA: CHRD domain-containing protein [Rhodocyclaceae bacterium]|nr:CHRD domain-containing protein [Rhodocyclaceae bacterium]